MRQPRQIDEGEGERVTDSVFGEDRMTRPDRRVAWVFLSLGAVAALLALYYYAVFLGLENPITHVFPVSFDYFAYSQNYYQTLANFRVCWEVSAPSFVVAGLAFVIPSIEGLAVFAPLHRVLAYLRGRSLTVKTAALAIPLVLLEAGLLLYGGLMGLTGQDLALSLAVGSNPVVRFLVMGPLGPFGQASRAAQDYYFLVLFLSVLAASLYRFGSVRRVVQVGALSVIPLPTLIFLFDRIEFDTFFASVVDRAGLPWFSNALLLYLSLGVFALATVYPAARRLAYRALERGRSIPQ
jgi:hypothetical protein